MAVTIQGHGARLRSARERLGLTQVEASERAGMPKQQWFSIERGKTATLDQIHRLAVAIGADPHEIDPRLCPARDASARTLTLVFAGADPERPALAGETDEDDRLVTELLPGACRLGYVNDPDRGPRAVASVGRSNLGRLVQAAGLVRVRLVIRADLAPRVVAPPEALSEPPTGKPAKSKKGGRIGQDR